MPAIDEETPSSPVKHVAAKLMESKPSNQSKPVPLPPQPRSDPRVIATWNVNGIRRAVKTVDSREQLKQANAYCQAKNLDVLFIQEAKLRCSEHGDHCHRV